jgi:PAS domain S-box-containing protein
MSIKPQPISHHTNVNTELLELKSILENIDRGFMSVDRGWRIVYANSRAAIDVERKADELIGQNFWAVFPELAKTSAEKLYRKAMDERVAVETEEYSKLTGCWNQQKVYPTHNGIVIAWADITARKSAQEALRQSEEKYRLIVDTSEEGIWVATPDGKATFVNQKMADMLGYSKEELLGKAGLDFLDMPEPMEVLKNREILDSKGKLQTECKFIKKDGGTLWTIANTAPIFDSQGKHVANIAMHTDITERKQAEEALEQTKNRLQEIWNGIDDGITLVGLDGKVLDCNRASLQLLGLEYKEFVGTNVYDIVVPEDRQRATNGASEVLRTGKVVNEVRVKRKNGSTFFAEISVTAICDKKGNPHLFLGVTRDITEHKKLENALKLSEEKFSKAFLNSPFAVTLTCLSDGKIVEANDSAVSLFGYARDEIIGKSTLELNIWTKLEERRKFIQELTSKGTIYNQELSLRKRDGTISCVLISASLIEIQGEKHFLSTFLDITKRRRAEQALLNAEEKFRCLVESTSDIIWQVDENAVYTYVSPKVKDILGYAPEELVGKTPFDFIDEQDEDKIVKAFLEIANKKEPFYGLENWNAHKNGSRVLLETSGVPILDENGQLAGYRGIDRDITERKKLQQELEKYAKDLEQLVAERTRQLQEKERLAAIGQTAGMVGHDIRNPLQAIIGDLYIAREESMNMPEGEAKQAMYETITAIEENIFYINKIVSDLQDYTRPLNPSFKETDLKVLLENIIFTIKVPRRIKTSINVEQGLTIKTDSDYLRRILTNLVINAVQAMPNEGSLIVQVKRTERSLAVFTVEDTGVGIPEDVKGKLFTPLFTTKSKGQGLGLAVVKRLVEGLNGNIRVESEEGKGTKFIIELPIKE